jgi:asparagine synthase (glutamine-hydrolysing)
MASRLAEQGRARPLGGTLTVVDSLSEGDETRYSNAVAAQYGLRNETLTDYWAWQDDAIGPPRYTEPHEFFPFYTRDREMCRRAKAAGARVLLSGQGADHYLSGRFEFAADLLVKRRYREAVDHLLNVAVTTRQSFWRTAFYHGLYHLAPSWLKRRYRPEGAETPSWLTPELVGAEGLDHRMLRLDQPATGYGFFADTCATEVASIDLSLTRGLFEEGLELRYPFLHRPLVEFGLRLPATMRARPHQQKWILREAMGNVLPDVVRARQGKGGVDGRITWSLNREQPLLRRLILDSHLADLGCVRQEELKQAFDNAVAGNTRSVGLLFVTLSLETWLAVRSGRWSRSRSSQPLMSQGVPASDAQIRKGSSNAIEAVVH